MTTVFWDTMLFVYLIEEHPIHGPRVEYLLRRQFERKDALCTSHLALGELLAGANRSKEKGQPEGIRDAFFSARPRLLPFDVKAAEIFGVLRAQHGLAVADTIHLACAASAGTDLFLTGDKRLQKLVIPGIRFIADLNTDLL